MTMKTNGRLAGRKALVAGASRGIGYAIAEAFAREGAELMLVATNREKLAQAREELARHGGRIEIAVADVSDRKRCFAVADETIAALGQLDILVNSAAVYQARPFLEYTEEDFDRIQKVNLYGTFHLMQAVLPHMLARQYGKIINIASSAGKWGSKNQSAYNVSKHGVVGMTRCVAIETARSGVTVNAICPGMVDTELATTLLEEQAQINQTTPEAIHQDLLRRIPMNRFIKPEECGSLAVYLASGESDGMTGQTLLLDGGMITA